MWVPFFEFEDHGYLSHLNNPEAILFQVRVRFADAPQ
jgi:hypothetical protein